MENRLAATSFTCGSGMRMIETSPLFCRLAAPHPSQQVGAHLPGKFAGVNRLGDVTLATIGFDHLAGRLARPGRDNHDGSIGQRVGLFEPSGDRLSIRSEEHTSELQS